MKKLLAIILALVSLFAFCGCAKKSAGIGENSTVEYALGTGENDYKNEFIGIGFKIPEGMEKLDEKTLREHNGVTVDMTSSDYVNSMKKANAVYDLRVRTISKSKLDKSTGSNTASETKSGTNTYANVTVVLENAGKTFSVVPDAGSFLKSKVDAFKKPLEIVNYENIKTELTTEKFLGKNRDKLVITANLGEFKIYEEIFIIKCGDYMAEIQVAADNQENAEKLLKNFYTL